MGVQRLATRRNRQAEKASHFILVSALRILEQSGHLQSDWKANQQVLFESDLTRDRWDHQLSYETLNPAQSVIVWGQTTCYKGHDNGVTEANKTYEVRETLTEALCLRARTTEEGKHLLVHITFGNPDYVYGWFRPMKESVFDLSIYINDAEVDVFELLEASIGNCRTESEESTKFEEEIRNSTPLGKCLSAATDQVISFLSTRSQGPSKLAQQQANLLDENLRLRPNENVEIGLLPDINVKKEVVAYLLGDSKMVSSQSIIDAAERIMDRKPFLRNVKAQLGDWETFVSFIEDHIEVNTTLIDQVSRLWTIENPAIRESLRRILVRLHSSEDIDYAQDFGISGVTEHNLYSGSHDDSQVHLLANVIAGRLEKSGIRPTGITEALRQEGKSILRSQLYFEANNGTVSKSSFDHIIQDLITAGYAIETSKQAGLNLTGYHAELTEQTVRPYTNFKIVCDSKGSPVCVLKAKFFSEAEFDRRCKEEAFVGLSLTFRWTGNSFVRRFPVPLVMCVDMPTGFSPPEFAVRKLYATGWDVVFGIEQLKKKLMYELRTS
jgi:hypothetical protein